VIKKVLEVNEEQEVLSADAVKILRWAIGEIGSNSIKGLNGLINYEEPEEEEEDEGE
jgi:hypothetical protein